MKRRVTFLLILFAAFFALSSFAAKNKSIDVMVTSNLGGLYFPLGNKDEKTISDFEKKAVKLSKKFEGAFKFDIGGSIKPPMVSCETSYSGTPIGLFKKCKFDAVNVAAWDLTIDEGRLERIKEFLKTDSRDTLLSNVKSADKNAELFKYFTIVEKKNAKIGVIGLTDINKVNFIPDLRKKITGDLSSSFIQSIIEVFKAKTDFNIVLSDLTSVENEKLIERVEGIDIIFTKCAPDKNEISVKRLKNTFLVSIVDAPDIALFNIQFDVGGSIMKISADKSYTTDYKSIEAAKNKADATTFIFGDMLEDKSYIEKIKKYDTIEENRFRGDIPGIARTNKEVIYYSIYDKQGKFLGNVYYILANMPPSYDSFYFLILVSPENKIAGFHSFTPMLYGRYQTVMPEILKIFLDKDLNNIRLNKQSYPGAEEMIGWAQRLFSAALIGNKAIPFNK